MSDASDKLHEIVNALPVQTSKSWAHQDGEPDCSTGCLHFLPLAGTLGCGWGVCACPASPRAGLLTWEHMGCKEWRNKNAKKKRRKP